MMFRRIGELTIDPSKASGCDNVVVELDDSNEPVRLRASFFKGNHFCDEVIVNLQVENNTIMTDTDMWKLKCLDLAAQLDITKRNGGE